MITASEQAFIDDFGRILVRSIDTPRRPAPDRAALDFARYLSAARSNAGLSRPALAARASMRVAELVALEVAAVPAASIAWPLIQSLAHALQVDEHLFALLLERDLPAPTPAPLARRVDLAWADWIAFCGSTARASVALAVSAAALGLALLSGAGALGAQWVAEARIIEGIERWTTIDVTGPAWIAANSPLVFVPLTLIGLLIPLLVWYGWLKRDLPWRLERLLEAHAGWVLHLTAFIVIMALSVTSLGFGTRLHGNGPLQEDDSLPKVGHSNSTRRLIAYDDRPASVHQDYLNDSTTSILLTKGSWRVLPKRVPILETVDPFARSSIVLKETKANNVASIELPWPDSTQPTGSTDVVLNGESRNRYANQVVLLDASQGANALNRDTLPERLASSWTIWLTGLRSLVVLCLYGVVFSVAGRVGRLRRVFGLDPRPG